ncbi:MAG: hypothetical protein AABX04_03630 [Nanoarchaeota archaeon]|mgnify:FL=1
MSENQPENQPENVPKSQPKIEEYDASHITVLEGLEAVRKTFDLNQLLQEVQKRGDAKILVEKYHFKNHSILARALNEAKVLKMFPTLDKSKASLISTFRVKKELDLFSKKHDIKVLPVRTLRKAVIEWKQSLSHDPLLLLSREQHEVLMGTVLGDGNLRKRGSNALFRVEHSEKQKEYLYWKYDLLKEFTLSEPKRDLRKNRKDATYSFTTFAHPVFNYYYNLFYTHNRKEVSTKVLEQLTPLSLAVWTCDDGSYCKSIKDLILCTNSFSLKEHQLMQRYFKRKWGLNCSVRFRDGKYYYLSFYKKDTSKLGVMIEKFIPLEKMKYKIGK